MLGSIGFQSVAGKSVSLKATFRGPVRRSKYGANDWRHESAACCLSEDDNVTCTSFSASANVAGVTTGPAPAPVPKVGGAPGVLGTACVAFVASVDDDSLRHAATPTSAVRGVRIRNCRRVFIYEEPSCSPGGITLSIRTERAEC